jgi:hypothetical protein
MVTTIDHGKKSISNLRYGDMVKTLDTATNKVSYTKFITYLHKESHILSEFFQVTTNQNKILKISNKHLIARLNNRKIEYLFAENLNLHDILVSCNNAEKLTYEKIIRIEKNVEDIGVYAPLTEAGTLLVDDILVSCYANTDNQDWAHFALKFYIYAKQAYEFIFENLFGKNFYSQSKHGIHWYADILINSLHSSSKFFK